MSRNAGPQRQGSQCRARRGLRRAPTRTDDPPTASATPTTTRSYDSGLLDDDDLASVDVLDEPVTKGREVGVHVGFGLEGRTRRLHGDHRGAPGRRVRRSFFVPLPPWRAVRRSGPDSCAAAVSRVPPAACPTKRRRVVPVPRGRRPPGHLTAGRAGALPTRRTVPVRPFLPADAVASESIPVVTASRIAVLIWSINGVIGSGSLRSRRLVRMASTCFRIVVTTSRLPACSSSRPSFDHVAPLLTQLVALEGPRVDVLAELFVTAPHRAELLVPRKRSEAVKVRRVRRFGQWSRTTRPGRRARLDAAGGR